MLRTPGCVWSDSPSQPWERVGSHAEISNMVDHCNLVTAKYKQSCTTGSSLKTGHLQVLLEYRGASCFLFIAILKCGLHTYLSCGALYYSFIFYLIGLEIIIVAKGPNIKLHYALKLHKLPSITNSLNGSCLRQSHFFPAEMCTWCKFNIYCFTNVQQGSYVLNNLISVLTGHKKLMPCCAQSGKKSALPYQL